MSDTFHPAGFDVVGWQLLDECPLPETMTPEELFIFAMLLNGTEREYKVKMRKLLAIVAKKLNLSAVI